MDTGSDSRRTSDSYPVFCSSHGTVYYTPRNPLERRSHLASPPSFPAPLIGPRQRRPHSIHIVSYPAGFIPHELRPRPISKQSEKKNKRRPKKEEAFKKTRQKEDRALFARRREKTGGSRILEKLFAAFTSQANSRSSPPDTVQKSQVRSQIKPRSRPVSFLSISRRLSRFEDSIPEDQMIRTATMVDTTLRPPARPVHTGSHSHRNSIMSVRSAKSVMSSSVTELQKPVASGSGLSCMIILAEPNVFLTGFDHDGHARHESANSTALLRGKLQLNISKNVKIKSVALKLAGKARTEWPEGIPPLKVDMFEEESLRTQVLTFFHAMHDGWETEYGNQCTFTLKNNSHNSSSTNLHLPNFGSGDSVTSLQLANRARNNMTAKELKRLSLQSVQSRSFGKGESPLANQVQAKGFKVFYPGTYEYSFELPIDHHQLETTKLQYGSVKWELETTIERAGAFKPNLHGSKEVSIVRVPDQLSLEMTEPISISRQWEDQLHYDIMISGKSFPIGTKIPIAFKLTPLAKVQVHKLKVFVTESIEYWTNDRRVTRKDPGRKILLLEKSAGKPLDKQYESSDLRVLSGGELTPDERDEARAAAQRRRTTEAERSHGIPQPLPEPSENLLGDLDLGLETYWGSTEIEMNVQIPTCEMMAKDKTLRLHPDCSWKNVNVYHWIKIVMRISRLDPEDPAGKRRRHFEISIDSPFTVLNCRATQANTALPQYSSPDLPSGYRQRTSCGCPDAEVVASNISPASSTGTLPMVESSATTAANNSALPMPPQAAHLATNAGPGINGRPGMGSPISSIAANPTDDFASPRPIHLLRVPSYLPPAFDADEPPPPLPTELMTPPPNYDVIVGTPSVDGLADYFARLANYEGPEGQTGAAMSVAACGNYFTSVAPASSQEGAASSPDGEGDDTEVEDDSDSAEENQPARSVSRGGRVNVANPRTPGGRLVPSRSFEMERPSAPFTLNMAGVVRRNAAE